MGGYICVCILCVCMGEALGAYYVYYMLVMYSELYTSICPLSSVISFLVNIEFNFPVLENLSCDLFNDQTSRSRVYERCHVYNLSLALTT